MRARSTRFRVVLGLAAACMAWLLTTTPTYGQTSTTATMRGIVEDSSGGVLPGATVTITNTGTRATQSAVSDERGQYLFSGLFPGTYDLKVELEGFKTYEQKAIALSPNDTRGVDVRLDVGQRTETITVTAQSEVIQTETGAREGVITQKQIDNLSIMGRSSLELLRIMPGVVTEFNIGESTNSAKDVQNYTVNGIRSSGNTAQLDGSNLLDIGCNCGMMVSMNNDMVQEVKVQSSNFAAEYGAGGMNVSAVTKAGTSAFHGTGYYYTRDSKFAANDRSNSIAGVEKPKANYKYPGFNVGGPIFFGDSYTRNKDKLFFFFGYEWQRQKIDSGSRFSRTYTPAMKNGDFSELLADRGDNLNSIPQLMIPAGFPGAGGPAPNNDMRPYMTPLGTYLASLYPDSNYSDPNNLYNYVYSALEPEDREELKARVDWNVTNNTKAFVRISHDPADVVRPRGGWWAPSDVALPTPNIEQTLGRSYSGNLVSVLSPSMTNEAVVSYTRLTLDNVWQDPSVVAQGAGGVTFQGFSGFPYPTGPELPTNILHDSGQVGNQWSAMPNVFAHNDSLQFSDKLTKLMGAHGLKFGITVERGQKQQDFQNEESGQPHSAG
jgi:Carboxypeptidase regulatory-like domain/TonB-dependent Receptor Plug Domain